MLAIGKSLRLRNDTPDQICRRRHASAQLPVRVPAAGTEAAPVGTGGHTTRPALGRGRPVPDLHLDLSVLASDPVFSVPDEVLQRAGLGL